MTEMTNVIQISDLQAFIGIAVILFGTGVAYGSLKRGLQGVEETLRNIVIPDLKDVRERFIKIEHRVEVLSAGKF